MSPVRRLVVALAVSLQLAATATAATIQQIVDQVSQTQYAYYLTERLFTHNGDNRDVRSNIDHDAARENIRQDFAGLGLDTSVVPFTFTYSSTTYDAENVVAVYRGTDDTKGMYVIGAHYDSAGTPGADDNASGVAGVLEAARVLSQYPWESTLVFIAFDAEEEGLWGSNNYAAAHASDDIRGMISLDMLAYRSPTNPDKASIYYYQDDSPLTTDLASALSQYGGLTGVVGQMGRSDHVGFDNVGFNAALLIEYNTSGSFENSYYHTALDSVDTPNYLDLSYATAMTRGVVGYLATHAGLVPEPGTLILLAMAVATLALARCRRRIMDTR